MKVEKEEMERQKSFVVKSNSYTVEYPTIGQLIDIESLKIGLSSGRYKQMISTDTAMMIRALDYIDMCAYFVTLCPELIAEMKIDITNLDALDSKYMLEVYKNEFVPWWTEYEKLSRGELTEDKPKKSKGKSPSDKGE